MAEAVGVALGALGVVGIFSTCIDVFKLVQVGCTWDRSLEILATNLENQKARFVIWGRAVGLDNADEEGGYDKRLDEPLRLERVTHTMRLVASLFLESQQFAERYGMRKELDAGNARRCKQDTTVWKDMFLRVQQSLRQSGKTPATPPEAAQGSSIRWAVVDRDRFMELVNDLRDLVGDLESLTQYPDIAEQRRQIARREIESISDMDSLELVMEAGDAPPDDLSDAASIRIVRMSVLSQNVDSKPAGKGLHLANSQVGPAWRNHFSGLAPLQYRNRHPSNHLGPSDDPRKERLEQLQAQSHRLSRASRKLVLDPKKTSRNRISANIFEKIKEKNAVLSLAMADSSSTLDKDRLDMYRQIRRDLREQFVYHDSASITFRPKDVSEKSDLHELIALIKGPPNTPYQDGLFYINIQCTDDYPVERAPTMTFITQIYHLNVDR